LTSMGLNDLDTILGGGQPLGTCILLREDRWTSDLARSLVKYWAAEAVSQEQRLIIPVATASSKPDVGFSESAESYLVSSFPRREDAESLLSNLPRNLHWDKQKRKAESAGGGDSTPGPSLAILDEEEEDPDEGLEVAWQYKKSVQQERSGLGKAAQQAANRSPATGGIFCHSYDLSGRMNEQKTVDEKQFIVDMNCPSDLESKYSQGLRMAASLMKLVETTMQEQKATRLLLYNVEIQSIAIALPFLLAFIRQQNLPVVVLVCTRVSSDLDSWYSLSRTADIVLSTEGFASRLEYPPPPEFRHLQGLLNISKVSSVTAATANGGGHFADLTMSRRPAAYIYGFKRDRRKLHIPLLHIPPEDYAEGGGSVGSGVRSGAGKVASSDGAKRPNTGVMGCASNVSGSLLDF